MLAHYLAFEGAKNIHVLQVLFGALEEAGCFWLLCGILIMIYIWSLVFGTPMIQILFSILVLKVQITFMSFKSWFGAFEGAGGFWLGFGILIIIWILSLVFDSPMIQMLALYLDFEAEKTCMSFKSWFGASEDTGGSWPGFWISISIWIWSPVFDTPMFQSLFLYFDLEGAKNIYIL